MADENKFAEFAPAIGASVSSACAESGVEASDAKFLVALSGGPDSTALLIALKMQMPSAEISACHINHGLRGAESDGDEEFCRKLCCNLGVELKVARLDFKKRRPPEDELREARYGQLIAAALALSADYICTAHTLDDQIETMLFRLFRGTAPQGLVGISAIRHLVGHPGMFLLRPMLKLSRAECLKFLKAHGVEAREDSSNLDLTYTRNYIRKVMVPLIGDRFPGFQGRLEHLRSLLEADDALLDQLSREQSEAVFGHYNEHLHLPTLRHLPEALSRRLIEQSLESHDIEVSFERIRRIERLYEDVNDGSAHLKTRALSLNSRWDLRFEPGSDRIVWVDKEEAAYTKQRKERLLRNSTLISLPEQGSSTNVVSWLNKTLRVETWAEADKPSLPSASAMEAFVDLSRIDGKLEVRMRRAGDTIQPLGMQEQVRLKKFIHTHKRNAGEQLTACGTNVVLASEHEVLWVVGVGLSERIKVFDRPTHHLTWLDLAPNVTIA